MKTIGALAAAAALLLVPLSAGRNRTALGPFTRPTYKIAASTRTGPASTWYVRPDLINCAEGIALEVEINPDGIGPPCPA